MSTRPAEIRVKNWERFQHYHKRNPPWIRLYRDLLDNPDYRRLTDSAARLLVEVWLLASELAPGGRVPYDMNLLAWRTGRASTDASIEAGLKELCDNGFLILEGCASVNASTDASTSTRQRGEGRGERKRTTLVHEEDFEEWWVRYPKRSGPNPKAKARTSYQTAINKHGATPEILLAAVDRLAEFYATTGKLGTEFVPQAVTWLNQKRWEDDAPAPPPASKPKQEPLFNLQGWKAVA